MASAWTVLFPNPEPDEDEPSTVNLAIAAGLLLLLAVSTPWTRSWNPLLPSAKRADVAAKGYEGFLLQ